MFDLLRYFLFISLLFSFLSLYPIISFLPYIGLFFFFPALALCGSLQLYMSLINIILNTIMSRYSELGNSKKASSGFSNLRVGLLFLFGILYSCVFPNILFKDTTIIEKFGIIYNEITESVY